MKIRDFVRVLASVTVLFLFALTITAAATPKMFMPVAPLNAIPDSKAGFVCLWTRFKLWAGPDWCLDEYDPPKQVEPTTPGPKDYCFTDRITPASSPAPVPRALRP